MIFSEFWASYITVTPWTSVRYSSGSMLLAFPDFRERSMGIAKIVMVIAVVGIVIGLGMSVKGKADRHLGGYAPASEFDPQNLIQTAPLTVISSRQD
jgi:hypothetical protein